MLDPETGYPLEDGPGDPPPEQCDWCGDPFEFGEETYPGYAGKPCHLGCQEEALEAYAADRKLTNKESEDVEF